jgi:hypothetical protein
MKDDVDGAMLTSGKECRTIIALEEVSTRSNLIYGEAGGCRCTQGQRLGRTICADGHGSEAKQLWRKLCRWQTSAK